MTGVPAKAVESVRSDWGLFLGCGWRRYAKVGHLVGQATFRQKWPVGPRRCPMSAKADAEAAAALRELGATLKASKNAPKLHTLKVLHGLGLDEEEDELELSMMEELATLVKNADGPAGDKVKYEHAVKKEEGKGKEKEKKTTSTRIELARVEPSRCRGFDRHEHVIFLVCPLNRSGTKSY